MKKFDILRYLRRFFALVLAVTMAGTVVVYWYCKNNQTYTASVNIKYLHDGIKDGFAPDGTAMNVDEIYSSKVISQAMESLGLQSGINLVRSHCTVEELIPDDQKALQEALIDKGEESTYFPDEYKVTLVVDGSLGASYARRVLDAIVSSYSTIYTEEYVELPLTMNPSSGLLNSGYDYYECVDALSADTTEVLNYLEDKKTNYPNFRSSVTGYSYEDLYDIYKMLYDYEIPSLYANVMTGPQVRNADKLCRNLTQSIESSVQNEQVYQEREAYLSGLIQNYSEKNRDLINYHYHNDANDSGTDYILKNVEAYDDNQSKQITYDSLILEYVEIDKTLRSSAIRRAYTQQLLDTFQAAGGVGGDEASHAAIESEINKYEQTLVDYYQIVNQTSMEHNRSLSGLSADHQLHQSVAQHQHQAVSGHRLCILLPRGLRTGRCGGPFPRLCGILYVCGQKDRSAQPRPCGCHDGTAGKAGPAAQPLYLHVLPVYQPEPSLAGVWLLGGQPCPAGLCRAGGGPWHRGEFHRFQRCGPDRGLLPGMQRRQGGSHSGSAGRADPGVQQPEPGLRHRVQGSQCHLG